MLEGVIKVSPGQNLLVISDTYARSRSIAGIVSDVSRSLGVNTVQVTMAPPTHTGQEPPPPVVAAMKSVDVIFEVIESHGLGHTTARKEATDAGIKHYSVRTDLSEDYFKTPVSLENLNAIKTRTEKLAAMLSRTSVARVTTPHGTELSITLNGRKGIALHPLSDAPLHSFPDYAEATIAPVEGTTEGVVVVDASVRGWGYVLRKPIRLEVKQGRVQVETISSDIPEQAERLKRALTMDENAGNCAAELGMGTSHTVPKTLLGTFLTDYAIPGTFHVACGRNNDIGGQTLSTLHLDLLMTEGSLKLDDVYVIENGELRI